MHTKKSNRGAFEILFEIRVQEKTQKLFFSCFLTQGTPYVSFLELFSLCIQWTYQIQLGFQILRDLKIFLIKKFKWKAFLKCFFIV
jgi:hypothetical protein